VVLPGELLDTWRNAMERELVNAPAQASPSLKMPERTRSCRSGRQAIAQLGTQWRRWSVWRVARLVLERVAGQRRQFRPIEHPGRDTGL